MKKKHIKELITSPHGIALGATGSVVILCVAFAGVYFETYALSEKIFPKVAIGSLEIGSLTKEQAREVLKKRIEEMKQKGVTVITEGKEVGIALEEISLSSDIGTEALSPIFSLDEEKTLVKAYDIGRTGSLANRLIDRTRSSFAKNVVTPVFNYDREAFERTAQQELKDLFIDPKAAYFEYQGSNKNVVVVEGQKGRNAQYKNMNASLERSLALLEVPVVPIEFIEEDIFPTKKDLLHYLPQAQQFAAREPLLLTFDEDHITLPSSLLVEWLTLEKNNNEIKFSVNKEKLRAFLEEEVAPKINKEARAIQFDIVNGVPTLIKNSEKGRKVLIDQSSDRILDALATQDQKEVELVIQEIDLSRLQEELFPEVREVIGKATTSFAGSPKNRIFNITFAAKKIHGVVVESGHEFSLIKFLGEIDEKSGFLPELVIKGNKTKSEFGGGLCQLSTTVFRAVSVSGLPVLERRNHSYRVPYYEPPIGYDATIYFPKPDFRFKNDTAHPILIQSGVQGTKITITLWGTKDGRKVEVDAPTVFNRKKPAEPKIIETTDLKPGQKKCIERAHEGSDAVFERRVTLANGELRKDVFKSHYVPWQAVCLVGKKAEPKVRAEPKDEPASAQGSGEAQPAITPSADGSGETQPTQEPIEPTPTVSSPTPTENPVE